MKLLTVLMLTALPLFCYADTMSYKVAQKTVDSGTGCQLVQNVIDWTIDGNLTSEEYVQKLQPYISNEANALPLITMKDCFNNQTADTLTNIAALMNVIYESHQCKLFKP